jgi:hypothetical protein
VLTSIFLALTSTTVAAAEGPPGLSEEVGADPAAPRATGADKVYLDGGEVVAGEVLEQRPGQHVIVRMENGEENRIEWGLVKKVVLAKGGSATPTPTKKRKRPVEKCDDDDADCRARSATDATASGGGIGVRGERVVHLKEPGNSATSMAIDGGFLYGTSTKGAVKASIYGGGANLNLTYRVGGTFPGEAGGSWHGFGVDAYAGVFGAGVVAGNSGAGMLLVNGGGAVGYQFFSFGEMSEETFKQHGFGVFAAGRVGASNAHVFGNGGSQSTTSAQYGPQLTISFPEYNFGTAQRSSFYLSGFILPTGDFLFLNLQAGGSFSL